MSAKTLFLEAHPYQEDVSALPVSDLDAAAGWYSTAFGMKEVERRDDPVPTVILQRDDTRIGFAVNGGDASQDGAAICVSNIQSAHEELASNGVEVGDVQVHERDGKTLNAFFVVAPDGLCYYFYQIID